MKNKLFWLFVVLAVLTGIASRHMPSDLTQRIALVVMVFDVCGAVAALMFSGNTPTDGSTAISPEASLPPELAIIVYAQMTGDLPILTNESEEESE